MDERIISVRELADGYVRPASEPKLTSVRVVEDNRSNVPSIIAPSNVEGVNFKNLMAGGSEVVNFTFENTDAVNALTIYFGTMASLQNTFTGLGITEPGNFSADWKDQKGASAPKFAQFNRMLNLVGGIVAKEINIISAVAATRNIVFTPVEFDWDFNPCNKTGRIPVTDTDINTVIRKGVFPLSPRYGFKIVVPKSTAVFSMELILMAEGVTSLSPL